jgi:hypothetical protein
LALVRRRRARIARRRRIMVRKRVRIARRKRIMVRETHDDHNDINISTKLRVKQIFF